MTSMGQKAEQAGHEAANSQWLDYSIRLGFITYGIVHLVIAWLAVQLALGQSNAQANQTGALHTLAKQPFGMFLIWVIVIGMFLLVVWKVLDGLFGHGEEQDDSKRLRKRLVDFGKAVVYAVLGVTALNVALHSGGSSKGKSTTQKIMEWPLGPWLIGLAGVAIIAYGCWMAYKGISGKVAEHLDAEGSSGDTGRAYLLFGKIGYAAKGFAIAVIGGLFVWAALDHNANHTGGLDEALHRLLQYPFGQVLLIAVAAGIACYGLFCFARARHLSR